MDLNNQVPNGHKSGFISLIGRPNVGKSTLINKLVGEKVAITSPVAQTTRNRLRAILTTANSQLILLDTPGIHKPHHLLGERLVQSAKKSIGEVDIILVLFDASSPPGRGDAFIVELLQKQSLPVFVVLNKWDLVDYKQVEERINQYKSFFKESFWPIYCCSAISGFGCVDLITAIQNDLPLGPQLYPPEMISDQPEKILLAELIREQVLLYTKEEIPHSVAVVVERLEELPAKKGKNKNQGVKTGILATVLVERKSQKGILIGKEGSMLKTIGKGARLQMQKLINGQIYLELFVKVSPDWRRKPSCLNELGYEGN